MSRLEEIQHTFHNQAKTCREMGSPFTGRLLALFAKRQLNDSAFARKLYNWPGDAGSYGDALALRIAGTLHALVLEQRSEVLAASYPPHHESVNDETLWSAIQSAIRENEDFFLIRLQSPPQTNEVRRSGVIFPGLLSIASLTNLPLVLSEVGASAGLNLFCDQFDYRFSTMQCGNPTSEVKLEPEWSGDLPPAAELKILSRAACDKSPVNPGGREDRLRMLSYIWPDQTERLMRTRAALHLASEAGVRVEKSDAIDWLQKRLTTKRKGAVHVIYHTIAWQYFDEKTKTRGEALITKAGKQASNQNPIARLSFEADGEKPGAALTLTLWPDGQKHLIARADYHGRWINWFGWPVNA